MTSENPRLPFEILAGEAWGIVGRNGSGKSGLAVRISGADEGPFTRRALVSFELEDALLEREIREDDSEFLDKQDPGRSVAELIQEVKTADSPEIGPLTEELGMSGISTTFHGRTASPDVGACLGPVPGSSRSR